MVVNTAADPAAAIPSAVGMFIVIFVVVVDIDVLPS
jgi:hypothetical protein